MACEMEEYTDPLTGKKMLRPKGFPGLKLYVDPLTGKTYLRHENLDDIDLDKLTPAERARVLALRQRKGLNEALAKADRDLMAKLEAERKRSEFLHLQTALPLSIGRPFT